MSHQSVSAVAATPSLLASFREYLSERFPVPVTLTLSVATALGAFATAQQDSLASGSPLVINGTALGGCLMVFFFLFQLRVFDEHKDFEIDAQTRPDRPVQRGLITLNQLKVAGAVAVAAQIGLALAPGVRVGWLYAVPLGYSGLMFFEFFAREWLSSRIALYALSHTVVMVLIAWALGARALGSGALGAMPPALWAFLALNLTAFIGVDVLRKTWTPESEVDGLDSYSKRFGVRAACMVGGATLLASAACAGYGGWLLGGRAGWLVVVVVVTAWGLYVVRGFSVEPTGQGEKKLEMVAGVHLLLLFFGLVVLAGLQHGVVFALGDHFYAVGLS